MANDNDMLKTDGYDLLATIEIVHDDGLRAGEVIVLGNGSTHFIVAMRPGDGDDAQRLKSFAYGEDWVPAYRQAVQYASRVATERR